MKDRSRMKKTVRPQPYLQIGNELLHENKESLVLCLNPVGLQRESESNVASSSDGSTAKNLVLHCDCELILRLAFKK